MTEAEWLVIADEVRAGIMDVGTTAVLIVPGAETGRADNPTFGPPQEVPLDVLFTQWGAREIDGSLILRTDKKLLVAWGSDKTVEPEVGHTVTFDGQTKRVVSPLMRIAPAGTPVLFILNLRG